jgi:hypothetical protein
MGTAPVSQWEGDCTLVIKPERNWINKNGEEMTPLDFCITNPHDWEPITSNPDKVIQCSECRELVVVRP